MDPGSSSFALQAADLGSSEDQAVLRLEPEVTLREIRTQDEYRACVALQKEVWGAGFTEIIPSVILMLGQKLGGVFTQIAHASRRPSLTHRCGSELLK